MQALSSTSGTAMSTTIYLARHGETTWNRAGRLQGRSDSPLTVRGVRQAQAMGTALRDVLGSTDHQVWASPIGRTRQTVAILCDTIGYPYHEVRFDDRLVEITLGDRDGYAGWRELARDYPQEAEQRRRDPWNFRHPNGESSQMVQDRVRPLLETWGAEGGHHVVVTHGVVSKILRGLHLGLDRIQTYALDRPQDAVHRLHRDGIDIIRVERSGQ